MNAFVMNEDGTRAETTAGNDLPLDVCVREYLDAHPQTCPQSSHRKISTSGSGEAKASGYSSPTNLNVTDWTAALHGSN
jgi:hypothetical protein